MTAAHRRMTPMPSQLWPRLIWPSLRRSDVGAALHVHVDELQRRLGLVKHAPAFHPVVSALQFFGRDGCRSSRPAPLV